MLSKNGRQLSNVLEPAEPERPVTAIALGDAVQSLAFYNLVKQRDELRQPCSSSWQVQHNQFCGETKMRTFKGLGKQSSKDGTS